ncbi:MAG TPA: hypothetical protein VMV49_08195 [Candidatus Deferrimicrobium sp.]|nr:hypothetical protein [Candidatus Deferrimicrobium sp.]
MSIIRTKQNDVEYIAIKNNNREYLLNFNPQSNFISLFSGKDLYYKFQNLLSCKIDGCIECNLTLYIKEAISKEGSSITELGITQKEANNIIHEINKVLHTNFPYF